MQQTYKISDVHNLLGGWKSLTEEAVRSYCRGGRIKAFKLPGGHWRVSQQEYERLKSLVEAGEDI